MFNRKMLLVIVSVFLAATILSACGAKATTLDVTMSDFKFEPSTWEVPAGAEVTLNLKNTGTLAHEWVIMVLGKDATQPFDDDDEPNIYWEHELEKGEAETLTFTAPGEPGVYNIVCGIAGHLEEGMRGTLVVK